MFTGIVLKELWVAIEDSAQALFSKEEGILQKLDQKKKTIEMKHMMVLYATEDKKDFSLPLMKKMNTLFCIHFPPPPLNNDLKRMSLLVLLCQ